MKRAVKTGACVLLMAAVLCGLCGCGADKAGSAPALEGTWQVNNVKQFIVAALNAGGAGVTENDVGDDLAAMMSIGFIFEQGGNAELVMSMQGEDEPSVTNYNWEWKDGRLYMNGEAMPCRVNGDSMTLTLSLDELSGGNGSGKTMDLQLSRSK